MYSAQLSCHPVPPSTWPECSARPTGPARVGPDRGQGIGIVGGRWGSEKAYQKHFYGGRYIGCDIGNPRYDQLARLFGADGHYVDHPDQIGDALRSALGSGKPAVVEIPIDPEEFPVPATAVRRGSAAGQGA